jgi:hypothetical protein
MDLSAFPMSVLLRWELLARASLALFVPLGVGFAVSGDLSGIVAALVAAMVSLSCLGPDVRSLPWSGLAAVGTAAATLIGIAMGGANLGLQFLLVFGLFALLGVAMLAGMISQLAVTPIAFLGMIAMVLAGGQLSVAVTVQVCAGAAWAFVLIVVLPRWSRWPRLPVPAAALLPDTELIWGMVTRPSIRRWGFPLLLGVLASAVLYGASILNDGSRPYWAVLGLIGALGPAASKTREAGWQTVVGTALGVVVALLLFQLPFADGALLVVSLALGLVGVLVLLTNGLLSKALLTVLVIVLVAILTGDDPGDVAGLRLLDYVIGAGIAMLAAGLAEYLAHRLEEDRPAEQVDLVA